MQRSQAAAKDKRKTPGDVGKEVSGMDAPKLTTDRRPLNSQFQGLAEHSLVGMAVFQDGRFLYVNPKYCEIFGYSREEIL
jgi:PAS domain-containing protein